MAILRIVNSCNLSSHFTFIIKLFLRSPRGGWIPHVMNSLPYGKNCLFFHREMSKKRKVMDDGFTWRKYDQKDVLGAKFPRLAHLNGICICFLFRAQICTFVFLASGII